MKRTWLSAIGGAILLTTSRVFGQHDANRRPAVLARVDAELGVQGAGALGERVVRRASTLARAVVRDDRLDAAVDVRDAHVYLGRLAAQGVVQGIADDLV